MSQQRASLAVLLRGPGSLRDLLDAMRAYEQGVLSHRLLPLAIKAWRQPEHEEFAPRCLWSIYNAMTAALSDRATSNPQQFAALTMQVNGLLDAATEMPA